MLHDAVGIERGHMTTIHSYTNDQTCSTSSTRICYRARAAAMSKIPTSTGAAKAVGLVLPELKGKLDGIAIRVPTPNVSLVDLTFVPKRDTSVDEINAGHRRRPPTARSRACSRTERAAGLDRLQPHPALSSTVAMPQTKMIEGKLAACSPGTTTSGASRPACATPPWHMAVL